MTQSEAKKLIKAAFAPFIGQAAAKAKIEQKILAALANGGWMSPLLIVAPAGLGKSALFEIIIGLVRAILGRRFVEFERGEECGSRTAFADVYINHVHDKPVAMKIDEFHEAKPAIRSMIRSLVQPRADRSSTTIRAYGDNEITYDPFKNWFLLATNEVDKLDAPFLSRMDRIDLELYSAEELETMLQRNLQGADIKFNDNTLRDIADANRGTGRDIVKWGDAIRNHCAVTGKNSLNKADVAAILKTQQTYPLGVTPNELRTLLVLEEKGPQQLKQLAAANLVQVKEQNANELYLLQKGLIVTHPLRSLTQQGIAYLAELRKGKFIAPSSKPKSK
jgi:Holliday junction resolvasome RuvABC ATP-dependent DNA helicase subunit